jgi:flagellar operon protein
MTTNTMIPSIAGLQGPGALSPQRFPAPAAASVVGKGSPGAFADIMKSKLDGLRFSAHAATRMSSRHIAMTPELVGKLEKAVSGAAEKGSRESLVLLKNCAFIVNIPNRTVVTAMDGESLKNNIFTNIDSTVLAD